MDKAKENTYSSNNQSLTVESCFLGTDSIHNLLKRLLSDIGNTAPPIYNGDTAAAVSAKEGGE